jgi:dihydroorotate dehydrogenase
VYTAFIFEGWRIAALINRGLLAVLERERLGTVSDLRAAREPARVGSRS